MFSLFRYFETSPPKLAPEPKPLTWETIPFARFIRLPSPPPSRTSDVLRATTRKPSWHALALFLNARGRSGDPLSRGEQQRLDARVRQVREIQPLFDASRLA